MRTLLAREDEKWEEEWDEEAEKGKEAGKPSGAAAPVRARDLVFTSATEIVPIFQQNEHALEQQRVANAVAR